MTLVNRAARELDRTVPGPVKSRHTVRQREWEDPPRDEWLESFFAWVAPVVAAGRGLYLWL